MKKTLAALVALCAASAGAQAGEIYGGIGLPGVMLGYAQPLNDKVTLRADVATLGSHDKKTTEEGIDYAGKIKAHRVGLFADWFALGGGFRLTGGVTFNDIGADLTASGTGQPIAIGNHPPVVMGPDDRFDVRIKFPKTTPYLGIGWGHQPAGKGLGFVFDLGASIGKAKVTGEASPSLRNKGVTQADIDEELRELRDGVGKIKAIPQISVGLNYRF